MEVEVKKEDALLSDIVKEEYKLQEKGSSTLKIEGIDTKEIEKVEDDVEIVEVTGQLQSAVQGEGIFCSPRKRETNSSAFEIKEFHTEEIEKVEDDVEIVEVTGQLQSAVQGEGIFCSPRKKETSSSAFEIKEFDTEEIEEVEDDVEIVEVTGQSEAGVQGEIILKDLPERGPYACPKCPSMLKTKSVLKRHINWHAKPKIYPCKHCESTFTSSKLLSYHKTEHYLKKFECAICGKCYALKMLLKCHLLSRHFGLSYRQARYTGGNLKCEECGKCFSLMHYYKLHLENHKHFKKCPYCWLKFKNSSKFRRHQAVCNQQKICKFCNRSFRGTMKQFLIHVDSHSKSSKDRPPELRCLYCKRTIIDVKTLSKHIQEYHRGLPEVIVVDGPFECTVCEKSFDNLDALENHAEIYSLGRIFRCALCKKVFKNNSSIQRHMQVSHTKKKKRPKRKTCRDCGKTFDGKTTLTSHQPRCSSRPFKCDTPGCKRTFRTVANLEKHRKNYQENLLSCEFCSYLTKSKYCLKIHMLGHKPEKPDTRLDCPKCPLAFEDQNSLQKHIRNYHMEYYLAKCAPPVVIETIEID